MQEGRENADD